MSERREFPRSVRAEIVHRAMNADGQICCEGCSQVLAHKKYEIDHTIPEAMIADKSRPLTAKDGQLLGYCCHRGEDGKTAKDVTAIAKVKRIEAKFRGFAGKRSSFPKPPPGMRFDWKQRRYVREAT